MWDCLRMAKTYCSPRSVRRRHRCSKWLLCSWRMVWWSWTLSTPMWVTFPLSWHLCPVHLVSYSSLFGLLPSVVRGSCPTSIQSVWVNSSLDPLRTSYSSLFCLRPSAMSYSENPYSALSPLCPSRPDTICSFTLSLPFLQPSPHSVLPVLTPFAL